MSRPITFDDFVPGAVMGETILVFEPALAQRWRSIFGDAPADGAGGAAEGAGLAVVMMMRAYLSIVVPRPPGNVHARQRLQLADTPRCSEAIRTVVTCLAKEIRRERRYVELRACGTGDGGRAVYDGHLTLIWAA
jgi:hypothetical protein